MNFSDLVKRNRSYRGFDESYMFSEEQLKGYVDLARCTASTVNLQPLKYKLIWKKDEAEQLLTMAKWGGALPELHLPKPGTHPTAFIVICLDTKISDNRMRYNIDTGIAAQTILLAAAEEGLGGCMNGSFHAGRIKETFGLEESLEPMLVIALGKPAEEIVLENATDGSIKYYRDDAGVHHVPKRGLEEIIC